MMMINNDGTQVSFQISYVHNRDYLKTLYTKPFREPLLREKALVRPPGQSTNTK